MSKVRSVGLYFFIDKLLNEEKDCCYEIFIA